jgi:hypothetical protein
LILPARQNLAGQESTEAGAVPADAQTKAPAWLVWLTATWSRTGGLALILGTLGLLATLLNPRHWGVGDDVGGFLGRVLGALIIRVLIQRKERAGDERAPEA